MMALRSTPLVALLIATSSLRVLAQGECKIDLGKPGQVKDADGTMKKFEILGAPEEKKKNFFKAVTVLTKEPDKLKTNMTGRNFLLGRALVNIAMLPDMPATVKRGDVGFATPDSASSVDLLVAADSAFDAVEAEQPGCKAETEEHRRKAFGPLVNGAVNAYNNREADSAEALTKRALLLYDDYKLAYIAYNVLGNVQQSKDDYPGAIASFRKMTTLMAGDTALADDRKNTMILVSQLMTAAGEQKEGDARKAAMGEVVTYLQEYLKEFPGDMKAQSGIARAQLLSGDEVAAKKLFDDMLANTDKYTDVQLLEAGVGAARAEKHDAAAALFEAGLKKNPYSRDGLFNIAVTYDQMGAIDKMPPMLARLTNVDPENPENYKLWARYWQAKAKQLKPAADKKDAAAVDTKPFEAANDSLLRYFSRFDSATVKVTFSLFSHDGGRHVLGGTVENLTEQDKSYALKFEFLDAAGTVLESKDVPVENVTAKGQKSFRVELTDKPGVLAFRYGPLPR